MCYAGTRQGFDDTNRIVGIGVQGQGTALRSSGAYRELGIYAHIAYLGNSLKSNP